MDIKEIRKLTGLSAQKFGDKYDIPLRTIQNWEGGVNTPPPYLVKLLERVVKEDIEEPFKPMVEIDLYSVIKQKYIERDVLDKIRAEIDKQEKWLLQAGCTACNVDIAFDAIKSIVAESEDNEKA